MHLVGFYYRKFDSLCNSRETSDLNIRRAATSVTHNLCSNSVFAVRERIQTGTWICFQTLLKNSVCTCMGTLCLLYGWLLFNTLNTELNPICYLLALLGAHHFLHVSRISVKSLTLMLLMSYIYIYMYMYIYMTVA